MNKTVKIWLIAAASLVLIGGIIFGGVMLMHGWDFTKLSTNKYETNKYEVNESYKGISVVTDTADVVFAISEGSQCFVECFEQTNMKHSVRVEDDTIIIKVSDTRKWYEYIGINFANPKITIYIPAGEYGKLSVKTDTGEIEIPKDLGFENIDISTHTGKVKNYASALKGIRIKATTGDILVESISAGKLDLSVSTGKINVTDTRCEGNINIDVYTGKSHLTNITCQSLRSSGDTGDIFLKNVIAGEEISIERSTGNVRFDLCDAAEIFVVTDTGDVTGSLASDKVFVTKTDTGNVSVPKSTKGGICEITTDTGNIRITVD